MRVLYPNYGASIGGPLDGSIGVGSILEISGAVIGRATGAYRVSRIHENQSATASLEINKHGSEVSIRPLSMKQQLAK